MPGLAILQLKAEQAKTHPDDGTADGKSADAMPAMRQPKDAVSVSEAVAQRPTLAAILSEQEVELNKGFKAWVNGPLDAVMGFVVLLHLAFMALMAQQIGHEANVSLGLAEPGPTVLSRSVYDTLDTVFFVVYVMDMLTRMLVLRRRWYYDPEIGIMYMNLFDAILVLVHALELIMAFAEELGDQSRVVRLWRLMRTVRVVRIIKTVTVFRQLRVLVSTMAASIGALFWSIVLLFFVKVGFALIVCLSLQDFILDEEQDRATRLEINLLYGSFLKALFTMFEATYSGGWPSRFRPVVDGVNPLYSLLFLLYVTVVIFALLRVVTAIFLRETIESTANDAELQLSEHKRLARAYEGKLEILFNTLDSDSSGWLSFPEFVNSLGNPAVKRYMRLLDLHVSDVQPLFEILDEGGDGMISVHEFVKGLTHVKGQARALDIMVLQRQSAQLLRACHEVDNKLSRAMASKTRSPTTRFRDSI
ncbi:Scn11a [Symbiodinium natans]|uniref:Scn11a protein n=1 Tax=Symbiodinium natans TaxID=878477 RepID=A0A812LN14_9DINO|nr:Scn11a [Symbiodinium natans]